MSTRQPDPIDAAAGQIAAAFEPLVGSIRAAAVQINEQCKPVAQAAGDALVKIAREYEAARNRGGGLR